MSNTGSKVGIYVRESRDDNGERYETIETQLSLLTAYVRQQNLGEIVAQYCDNNISGTTFERPGILQLRADAQAHIIDILLLKDLSRLGRSNALTLLFLDFLQECGVRVLTYDGRYDSERDAETVGIDSWYNERYVMDISRKIRANLRHKIERGEYVGNAPYGYRKIEGTKGKLEIYPDEAAVVQAIYDMYCSEMGYKRIAALLNAKKLPPPDPARSQSGRWNESTIRRILSNRVYLGDTIQGVSEKISYKNKKKRMLPESRWVITGGTHEPIISQTQFEEVCAIRNRRRRGSGNYKTEIPVLKGLLRCSACGAPMYARKERGAFGYICSRYAKFGKDACGRHYVDGAAVLHAVTEALLEEMESYLYTHPDFAGQQVSVQSGASAPYRGLNGIHMNLMLRGGDPGQMLCSLQAKLELLKKKQELLYTDRLEGRISLQMFEKFNEDCEKKAEKMRNDMERIREYEKSLMHFTIQEVFAQGTSYLRSGLYAEDPERYFKFLRQLLLHTAAFLEPRGDRLILHCKFCAEYPLPDPAAQL